MQAERRGSQLGEAVRAPLFRANSVVDEEQPARIVFSFDCGESSVVAPPVRVLKSLLEVIAFADIRSGIRHECTKVAHASIDALPSFAARRNRWLVPSNSRICGPLAVGYDRQSKGAQHCWICGGVARSGDGLGWRAGESLVEVQSHTCIPRAGKQGVGQTLLRVVLE